MVLNLTHVATWRMSKVKERTVLKHGRIKSIIKNIFCTDLSKPTGKPSQKAEKSITEGKS